MIVQVILVSVVAGAITGLLALLVAVLENTDDQTFRKEGLTREALYALEWADWFAILYNAGVVGLGAFMAQVQPHGENVWLYFFWIALLTVVIVLDTYWCWTFANRVREMFAGVALILSVYPTVRAVAMGTISVSPEWAGLVDLCQWVVIAAVAVIAIVTAMRLRNEEKDDNCGKTTERGELS